MTAVEINTVEQTTSALKQYYREKYGVPKDDEDALRILGDIFKELMDYRFLTTEVKEGIAEYYRLIQSKGLPAFEWLLEAFHVTSKKNEDKRNFPYVVGIIRGWLKFGFGHIPSEEEAEITDYFKEVTGVEHISTEARSLLQNLMGRYGVLRISRVLGQHKDKFSNVDLSKIMMLVLQETLQEKYGDR